LEQLVGIPIVAPIQISPAELLVVACLNCSHVALGPASKRMRRESGRFAKIATLFLENLTIQIVAACSNFAEKEISQDSA
jgi:hypothetical protein